MKKIVFVVSILFFFVTEVSAQVKKKELMIITADLIKKGVDSLDFYRSLLVETDSSDTYKLSFYIATNRTNFTKVYDALTAQGKKIDTSSTGDMLSIGSYKSAKEEEQDHKFYIIAPHVYITDSKVKYVLMTPFDITQLGDITDIDLALAEMKLVLLKKRIEKNIPTTKSKKVINRK